MQMFNSSLQAERLKQPNSHKKQTFGRISTASRVPKQGNVSMDATTGK
jgi:hypothetical protein